MEIMMGIFESGAYGLSVDLPQKDRSHPLIRWRQEAGMGALPDMPRAYGDWLNVEGQRLGWGAQERKHRVKLI